MISAEERCVSRRRVAELVPEVHRLILRADCGLHTGVEIAFPRRAPHRGPQVADERSEDLLVRACLQRVERFEPKLLESLKICPRESEQIVLEEIRDG